jgi:hypothetical protein
MANLPEKTDLLDWNARGEALSRKMLSYHDEVVYRYPTTPYGAALCHSDPETFSRDLHREVSEKTHCNPWVGCSWRGHLVTADETGATVAHCYPIGD